MKLFHSAQMRAADAAAADAGIPGRTLMAAAGAAVATMVTDLFPACRHVLVLCGKGNNGGDGYVAALRLREAGVTLTVLEVGEPSTADAAAARSDLQSAGTAPRPLERAALEAWLHDHRRQPTNAVRSDEDLLGDTVNVDAAAIDAVVVDALLGCGLDRPLTGRLAQVVESVNASGVPVLSIDVPTGIDADSAALPGPHVEAAATIQLAGAKVASAFYPARLAYGRSRRSELDVADIGIPGHILDALSDITLLTAGTVATWLPQRPAWAHKYSAGTVTVVAGSAAYAGAGELACRGAWRGGAGLVTLVGNHQHPAAWPETIHRPLGDEWPPPGLKHNEAGSCVVGPGLAEAAAGVLPQVLNWAHGTVVIDATALTPAILWAALEGGSHVPRAEASGGGRNAKPAIVLTPHAGEAGRLLHTSADAVNANPLAAAARLRERSGATVVLKGPSTVVAAADGRLAVSARGHRGMAAGGTGDVLAGLIGALTATDGDTFERTCLAVYVHGVAGERAAAVHGLSLRASDLLAEIGGVLTDLASGGC